jgi:hypothetical protein
VAPDAAGTRALGLDEGDFGCRRVGSDSGIGIGIGIGISISPAKYRC